MANHETLRAGRSGTKTVCPWERGPNGYSSLNYSRFVSHASPHMVDENRWLCVTAHDLQRKVDLSVRHAAIRLR